MSGEDERAAAIVGRDNAIVMHGRELADRVLATVKRSRIARELAEAYKVCDRQRAEHARRESAFRIALLRACSIATTHRAEDREEVLELSRLARSP